ncbi:MAG: selenocysteine-specific translation elongation factor [Polyangia bacterium]
MRPVIIGTAGHIDHGKTALVKALTGTDTDRLSEEKQRGITIELGYAFLREGLAVIDVPGHERFVKQMVAGAATIDLALLVVAADDGVMPQTREHLEILSLLGVSAGAVAITKIDLVDEDWLELVEEDLREEIAGSFLEGSPVVRVDSLSGRGVEEIRGVIEELAAERGEPETGPFFRLPIDRVFTMRGFGTVVTGSVVSGSVEIGDRLELLPAGKTVRVRGIQSQGREQQRVSSGMRAALNLPQIGVDEADRGDVLATSGRMRPTYMLDAECALLPSSPVALEQRQRVRLHVGTKEVLARVRLLDRESIAPGEQGLVQLRLEERVAAQRLDRYVIRRYSPQITIGGGRLLDANPGKHRRRHSERVVGSLRRLGDQSREDVALRILETARVADLEELVARSGLAVELVERQLEEAISRGDVLEVAARGRPYFVEKRACDELVAALVAALKKYHERNPLRAGAKRGEILGPWKKRMPDFAVARCVETAIENGAIRAPGGDLLADADFEIRLDPRQEQLLAAIERALSEGGFRPPDLADLAGAVGLGEDETRQLAQVLVDRNRAINLEGKIYFHLDTVRRGADLLRGELVKNGEITMSGFRQLVGTTRKYALPLLNYYDAQGLTARRGDVRVPGRSLEESG